MPPQHLGKAPARANPLADLCGILSWRLQTISFSGCGMLASRGLISAAGATLCALGTGAVASSQVHDLLTQHIIEQCGLEASMAARSIQH